MFRLVSGRLTFRRVALIVTIITTGCDTGTPTAERRKAPDAVPVRLVAAEKAEVRRTSTQPATVHAFYRADVRAQVSGYVGRVQADIGDVVAAGATLAEIEVPELLQQRNVIDARIARSESEERRAEAGIALAEAGVRSAEARREQAQSEMSRVEAALAAMEAEFLRTQDLVQRGSLESRLLDEVRKKRDSERAGRDAAASAIRSAEADVTVARARRNSARAELEAAQADTAIAHRQRDEIDVLVAFATVKAPFAGIVTQRRVDPGDLVGPGGEGADDRSLFVVSQIETVRVHIPVPEADAAFVSRNDAVTLRFPEFSGEDPLEATVTRLTHDLDPDTRTMLVEAVVPNPDRKLLPGMFGEATITLSTDADATVLPARAVRHSETGDAWVYLVRPDATVSVTPVTTGRDDGHTIQIVAGVQPGQQVVDAHRQRFRDGQKVTPLDR